MSVTLTVRHAAHRAGAIGLLKRTGTYYLANHTWATATGWYERSRFFHKRRLSFFSQFIMPGDLCFDVGANMGGRTTLFLELGARVVCVEPQEDCLRVLREAYATHPNVVIVDNALGDRTGQGQLLVSTGDHALSTLSPQWTQSPRWTHEGRFAPQYIWGTTQPVTIVTLDSLIAQYGIPRFCKIDVEGGELAVLDGLSQRIPVLSFEITSNYCPEAQKCLDRITSLGPVVFNFSWGDSMQLLLPTWVSADELLEKIGAADDPALWGDIYARFL